jgi:hypothetical protein
VTEVTYLGPKPPPEPGEPVQRVESDYRMDSCVRHGCGKDVHCADCGMCVKHCCCGTGSDG